MSKTSLDIPGTWEHGDPGTPIVVPLSDMEQSAYDQIRAQSNTTALSFERYRMGTATIFVAREPAGRNGAPLWHASISRPNRHPTWDDIKAMRYRLLPRDLMFGMFLPPPELYVNLPQQDHVFHIWECNDPRDTDAVG